MSETEVFEPPKKKGRPRNRKPSKQTSVNMGGLPKLQPEQPSKLFSTFAKSQSSARVATWDATGYLVQNPAYIDLEHNDWFAGGTASPRDAAMDTTTNPTEEIDYAFFLAQRAEASLLEKDDWVQAQEINTIRKAIGDIVLVGVLVDQLFYHKYIPSSKMDDALAANELKWTENSVADALARLERNRYPLHPFTIAYLKSVMVHMRYETPYAKRGHPGGVYRPNRFKPMTFANWVSTYQHLSGISASAGLHWKRIGTGTTACTRALVEGIERTIQRDSLEGYIHRIITSSHFKDGGGNACLVAYGFSNAGALTWADVDVFAPVEGDGQKPTSPSDLWAFISFFNGIYTADNEYCPKIGVSPTTNSYLAVIRSSFSSTAAPTTEIVGTAVLEYTDIYPNLHDNMSFSINGGGAAISDTYSIENKMYCDLGDKYTIINAPYSEALWDEMCIDVFRKFIKGQPLVG